MIGDHSLLARRGETKEVKELNERERGHHTARKTQKNNNRTGPNRSVESNAGVPARVSVCVYVEGKAVTHAETTRDDQQLAGTA